MFTRLKKSTVILAIFASSLMAADNEHALALYQKAETAFAEKKYKVAIKYAERALAIAPQIGETIRINQRKERRIANRGYDRNVVSVSRYDTAVYKPKEIVAKVNAIVADIRAKASLQQKKLTPPNLKLTAFITDADSNGILDATESARVIVTVQNIGKGHADQVKVTLSGPNGVSLPTLPIISKLMPGEKSVLEGEFELPRQYSRSRMTIVADLTEFDHFSESSYETAIVTKAYMSPRFDVEIDSRSDVIVTASNAKQYLKITNKGKGAARDVRLSLNWPEDGPLGNDEINLATTEIDVLAPGESKLVDFTLYTKASARQNDNLGLFLNVQEKTTGKQQLALDLKVEQEARVIASSSGRNITRRKTKPQSFLGKEARQPNPNALVILIGNNDYLKITDVDFALDDISLMEKTFKESVGVLDKNIFRIQDATLADFYAWFGNANKSGRIGQIIGNQSEMEVHVYYSGHGFATGDQNRPHILPVDAAIENSEYTGVDLQYFISKLDALPVKSVNLYLDACYSGLSGTGEPIYQGISPAAIVETEIQNEQSTKTNVFSAASPSQAATWYFDAKQGLFTFYLAQGLQGRADENRDGKVSNIELANYVGGMVPQMAGRQGVSEQKPVFKLVNNQAIAEFE